MAIGVTVLGTRPGTEFLGGTQTRAVVVIEAKSTPSGVYFETLVPQKGFVADFAKAAALAYASIFESALKEPFVAGVFWSQEPNAAGELEDTITFTVTSTSGNSEAQYTAPIHDLGPRLEAGAIDALHAELDAMEG